MKYIVPTAKRRLAVRVQLQILTLEPQSITIVGTDKDFPKTKYFQRTPRFSGQETLFLSLPNSPNKLLLEIYNIQEGTSVNNTFKIINIDTVPLITDATSIPLAHRSNIRFLENFSIQESYLAVNKTYNSSNSNLTIKLLPYIQDDSGNKHPTPARIHKQMNLIQVSKTHFDSMTVPMRIAILLHEYSHNYMNGQQDNEFEADQNGMNLFAALGYPYSEAVKAYAKMFAGSEVDFYRTDKMYRNLDAHYVDHSII